MYKLSIQELIEPGTNIQIPFTDKREGAEQLLIHAIEANKKYSALYKYQNYEEVRRIATIVGKSTDFSSINFARNVFLYQINVLGTNKENADGQFDPPLVKRVADNHNINLDNVVGQWRNLLNKNWMGHRWTGRRHADKDIGNVYKYPIKSAQIVGDFTGSKPSDKYHAKGHWGTDFGNVPKGTPIFPIAPGVVTKAGDFGKGGNGVKIDHQNGVKSYYAHMHSLNVKAGDKVNFNTIIGTVGATGNARGSVHVHLETSFNGTKIDPMKVIGKIVKVPKNILQ